MTNKTEITAPQLAARHSLTVSAIQRKAQRIRARGLTCGTYKYERWLYTERDAALIAKDWRKSDD